jgi:two-component sensor histidine kinase
LNDWLEQSLRRQPRLGLAIGAVACALVVRAGLLVLFPDAIGQMAYAPAALVAGLLGGWAGGAVILVVALADPFWLRWPTPLAGNVALLLAMVAILAAMGMFLARLLRRQDESTRGHLAEMEQAKRDLAAATDRQALLHRELTHRVKNNFQLVGSLLRLQARRADDPTATRILNATVLRIQAMSALHESLYRNRDLGHVDVKPYLHEVCTRLAEAQVDGRDIRVTVQAESAELPGEYVLPLGLAISEMVSNSLRHAFKGGLQGEVRVSFERQGEDFILAVEDDGPDLDDPETLNTRGFGMLLVASCAQQVEGELKMSHHPSRFEIRFPSAIAISA